jgi:hypothetical protein
MSGSLGTTPLTDTITAGDSIYIFSAQDSVPERLPYSDLLDALEDDLTFPNVFVQQYATPSATGFTVAITTGSSDIWLILTPLAGYAAGTLTLPLASTARDGQQVRVNCTQSVTTLTISANGAASVIGAPTTLAANAFFTLAYDMISTNWYRVA